MSILSRIFGSKKANAQSKGIKRLANRGLKLELLEDRQLLSATQTISPTGFSLMTYGEDVTDPDNGVSHTSESSPIAKLNFNYHDEVVDLNSVTFGFVVAKKGLDSEFVPGGITVTDNANNDEQISPLRSILSQDGKYILLVTLAPSVDGYTINVSSDEANYGEFECEVFLPGDLNGDGLVSTEEVNYTLGAVAVLYNNPWGSSMEDQIFYGQTRAWYQENSGNFDHNLDGMVSDQDQTIVNTNGPATQGLGSDKSLADYVKLNADQEKPVIDVPEPEADSKKPYYEVTNDEDGNLKNLKVDSTNENSVIMMTKDPNPIKSVTINGTEIEILPTEQEQNLDDGTWTFTITADMFRPGGLFAKANVEIDNNSFTVQTIFITDSYGNETESFTLEFKYEDKDDVAKPEIDEDGMLDPAKGNEKPDDNTFVFYTGDLSKYVYSADTQENPKGNKFIYIAEGEDITFEKVTELSLLDEPNEQYDVVYSITEQGAITIKLVDLRPPAPGLPKLDPYAWLSTAKDAEGHDYDGNKKEFSLPFKVANIFHKYFATNTTDTTGNTYWQSGDFLVKLTPENDAPTANDTGDPDTRVIVEQGKLETVDVLANVSDKDDWDTLSVKSVTGKDGEKVFSADKVLTDGEYADMMYVDIEVSGPNNINRTIRVINNTNDTDTKKNDGFHGKEDDNGHTLSSKLVVDLLGNFDLLQENVTFDFDFTYTVADHEGATASAKAYLTAKGINDKPVAQNVTNEVVGTERAKTTYTLDSEVTDKDSFTAQDTFTVNSVNSFVSWNSIYGNDSVDPEILDESVREKYQNIKSKMTALASKFTDYVSIEGTDSHTIAFDPVTDTEAEPVYDFEFLRQGEWVTLTYQYTVTDSATETPMTSEPATITFRVNGVNNKPVVNDSWTHSEADEKIGDTITISLNEYDRVKLDADVNDTHTFHQVLLKNPQGNDYSLQVITGDYQQVHDPTGKYIGQIRYKADSDQKELEFQMNYQSGYDASDSLKWAYSNHPDFDTATLPITLTVKDDSGAEDGSDVSDPFTVQVEAAGTYDAPEIKPDQSIIISVSTATTSTDWNKAFTPVDSMVDAGYTKTWSLANKFKTKIGEDYTSEHDNDYFEIDHNGKLAFTSAEVREDFVTTFMPNGTLECDIQFAVTLTDNAAEPKSVSEDVEFKVMVKMPPKVTPNLVDTGIVVDEEGKLSGTSDTDNKVTYSDFDTDFAVSFADDEDDVATPTRGDRTGTNWYKFSSPSWNRAASYVSYNDGNETQKVYFAGEGDGFDDRLTTYLSNNLNGLYRLNPSEGSINPTFELDIVDSESNKIFNFLSQGDTATLVFDIAVTDVDFGCSTTVQISVTVTGVNDAPVLNTNFSDQPLFTKTDTETGGTYVLWGTAPAPDQPYLFSDPDWRDSVSYDQLTYQEDHSEIHITDNETSAENAANYLGMDASELLGLLTNSSSQSEFSYATHSNLQKLPQGQYAHLTYLLYAKDNNNATSANGMTVYIHVNGTNQNPTGISDKSTNINLQEATSNETINLLNGVTDVDTGAMFTAKYDLANHNVVSDAGTLKIMVGNEDKTDVFAEGFRNALSQEGGVITLNNGSLVEAFKSLQHNTVATVTFNYSVHDEHDAYCVDADNQLLEKTVTINITGKNDAPTQEDITLTGTEDKFTAGNTTGIVIDWQSNSSDPDSVLADDTRILAKVDGNTVTSVYNSNGSVTYTAQTYTVTDENGNSTGQLELNENGTLTYYPSGNYLKWQLNAYGENNTSLPVSFEYQVKDQHGTSSTEASTVTVTVNGAFDKATFDTIPNQQVPTVATPGEDSWVKLPAKISYTCDINETYVFSITDASISDGSTGTFTINDFKIEYDLDSRSSTTGQATASVYVTKSALETCNDPDKLPTVTVTFSYTNSQSDDHEDAMSDKTFTMEVISKSPVTIAPAQSEISQTTETTQTWTLNGVEGLDVTDPENAGITPTVLELESNSEGKYIVTLKNYAIYNKQDQNLTLLENNAWTLSSDQQTALINCVTISKDAATGVFTLNFEPNEEAYKFLPKDYKLLATFEYIVTSYETDCVTYAVNSPGTIVMTITGTNDAPNAQTFTDTSNAITEGTTNIPLADFVADGTINAIYDIDGNPVLQEVLRVDDLPPIAAFNVWDPTAGTAGTGDWVRLVAGDSTKVAKIYSATNSPTVQLVYGEGNEAQGQANEKVYLRVITNGYYAYRTADDETPMEFKFRAVDQYDQVSLETTPATAKFTVQGKYVAPTFTEGSLGIQAGDVAGYTPQAVGEETPVPSNGQLRINLKDIGFEYTPGTCTFSLEIPAASNTDFLVKVNNAITEGTSYYFDKTDPENVALVFQFISKDDFNERIEDINGFITDIAGSQFDMSPLKNIKIKLDDGHGNEVESSVFDVKCKQQNTLELFLIATLDQNIVGDNPQKAGTAAEYYDDITDRTFYTYYMAQSELDLRFSQSTQITKMFDNGKYGYYTEIWLQDNLFEYYGTTVNGVYQLHFLVEYQPETVKSVTARGTQDPGKVGTNNSSVGWGFTKGDGSIQGFYPTVYDPDSNTPVDAFYIDIAWNLNTSLAVTVPLESQSVPLTRYGMDGDTAVLVCCLFVELEEGKTPADASMRIRAAEKEYDITPEIGDTTGTEIGYTYKRSFRETDGFADVDNRFELNDSQIISHYQQYTSIAGTSEVELVTDGGIYVRTVSKPSEETLVSELSGNMHFVNEWQSHYAEIWVKASDSNIVSEAGVTLSYNPEYFAPNTVEFDGILGQGNYTIDYEAGTISITAESTSQVAVNGYILVGRVGFSALDVKYTAADGSLCSTDIVGIPWIESTQAHDLGWALGDGYVNLFEKGRVESYLGLGSTTEVWAVPYDCNDDGIIGTTDFTRLNSMYGKKFGALDYDVFFDFNRDGLISTSDYVTLNTYFGRTRKSVANGALLSFPTTFMQRYIGSTLQTSEATAQVGQVLDAANNVWKETLGLADTVDVQLYVTNLTNGDLAQSTVTKYDENGLPTAGVIYLDDDGIGQTWYAQLKADGSGSTKYDLYTVLLHELGHLYGYNMDEEQFSSISSQFDFLADEDGHSTVETDLMYADVAPGVRKEISVNDAYALATRYVVYSAGYTMPEALAEAWAARSAVNTVVVQNTPEIAASIIQEELVDNNTILMTTGTAAVITPKEGVERATLEKLSALGVNVPGVTLVENTGTLADEAIDGLFPEEDDDDEEVSLIPTGSDNFESVIDSVLEEFGE